MQKIENGSGFSSSAAVNPFVSIGLTLQILRPRFFVLVAVDPLQWWSYTPAICPTVLVVDGRQAIVDGILPVNAMVEEDVNHSGT